MYVERQDGTSRHPSRHNFQAKDELDLVRTSGPKKC